MGLLDMIDREGWEDSTVNWLDKQYGVNKQSSEQQMNDHLNRLGMIEQDYGQNSSLYQHALHKEPATQGEAIRDLASIIFGESVTSDDPNHRPFLGMGALDFVPFLGTGIGLAEAKGMWDEAEGMRGKAAAGAMGLGAVAIPYGYKVAKHLYKGGKSAYNMLPSQAKALGAPTALGGALYSAEGREQQPPPQTTLERLRQKNNGQIRK